MKSEMKRSGLGQTIKITESLLLLFDFDISETQYRTEFILLNYEI